LTPVTAPFAMPGRVALGATEWWEPWAATFLAVVAIAGLVRLAGRVYSGAVLHAGPALKLRDAWGRAGAQPAPTAPVTRVAPTNASRPKRRRPRAMGAKRQTLR
jgi:ABC-2 type transport system permease protein